MFTCVNSICKIINAKFLYNSRFSFHPFLNAHRKAFNFRFVLIKKEASPKIARILKALCEIDYPLVPKNIAHLLSQTLTIPSLSFPPFLPKELSHRITFRLEDAYVLPVFSPPQRVHNIFFHVYFLHRQAVNH